MADTTSDFHPRGAALRYAGEVAEATGALRQARGQAAALNAIVCSLVYIGDELASLRELMAQESDRRRERE